MMHLKLLKFFTVIIFFSNITLANPESDSLPKTVSAKEANDLNFLIKIAGMKGVQSCTSNKTENNVTVQLQGGKEVKIPVVS